MQNKEPAARGIGVRRRDMKSILREGLEAALRARPEVLEKCKPKTSAGLVVRSMVLEAGKGKSSSLRTIMSLLEWNDWRSRTDEEPDWDWSVDRVWDTMPVEEPEPVAGPDDPAQSLPV